MGLKLLHLHLHGLIRSKNLELGRDSDTGGQTLYVLELVKELATFLEVEKVDLVTRLIKDRRVSAEYSQPKEIIVPGALIMQTLMHMFKSEEIILSERALREGLIVDWMLRRGLLEDRFSFQRSIRSVK